MASREKEKKPKPSDFELIKKTIDFDKFIPITNGQEEYQQAMEDSLITLCTGPAGSGKSTLAAWYAADMLVHEEVKKIILTRPAYECGESLGFLPGSKDDKISPYLIPMFDALNDFLGAKVVKQLIFDGIIELAPLSLMRGRSFNDAFVILDESQNATYVQLRMFLTRIGRNCKMVATGDGSQSDFRNGQVPFMDVIHRLRDTNQISCIELTESDVVRNPLINIIEKKLVQ